MRKIVGLDIGITEPSYESEVFSKIPDVTFVNTTSSGEQDVIEKTRDAEVILFTSAKLTREVISKLEKCKLIIRHGIGYDNVDTEAARERGIIVCNSPKYGIIDVAEHAISLLLATAKRIVESNDRIRDNKWGPGPDKNVRLSGKTLGFMGFGNIGKAVCERMNAFGMKPIVYDPYVSEETLRQYGAEKVSMDELLRSADFITCHLPLNDKTFHILGAEQFKKMKNTAILINTSRGGVINEAELIDALERGELAGVGLDVFEDEKGGMDKRMLKVKNAVLTPHVAWNTPDAIVTLHREVTDNVVRYLNGERPESIVNGL